MNLVFTKASKKPIDVDVLQLTDSLWFDVYNESDHCIRINGYELQAGYVEEIYYYSEGGEIYPSPETKRCFYVNTLEDIAKGKLHKANINDWLIIGVRGEIYACAENIFEETYELKEVINEH